MIGSLLQVKVDYNLSEECVSKYRHTRFGNARGALLSLLILALACLGSVKADAQNWTGSTVSNAVNKTVYLWNVGAKQFLGKGDEWGTEAIISNVGTPFKVVSVGSSTYRLESFVKGEKEGTSTLGALSFMNGKNSTHNKGNYFVDRSSDDDSYGTRSFTFSGDQKGYQMTVASTGGITTGYTGTFYLFANMAGNKKAKGVKTVPSDSTAYSKWIIVTEDELKEYFKVAEASEGKPAPATFLMFDNGFDRNDSYITKWQTKSSSSVSEFDGKLDWKSNTKELKPSDATPWTKTVTYYTYTYTGKHDYTYGLWGSKTYTHNVTYTVTTTTPPAEQTKTLTIDCDKSTTSAAHSHTAETVTVTLDATKTTSETKTETNAGYVYYNGNGYIEKVEVTVDEDGNTLKDDDGKTVSILQQQLYGGDWTANIHGSYGVVNQTIPNENMIREGWYKVSCVGFTTMPETDETDTKKAVLYASAGTANEKGKFYAETPLKNIDPNEAPKTYVKASRLINGGGYEASVMVYVGPKSSTDNTLKTLSFGILVEGAESTTWTCFDDFQIDYLGMPNTPLVLDEDQTSVDYINKQTTPDGETVQKKTLYLHRTLNANKWNSIVLPVSLTVGDVQTAFGDNILISEFVGAKDKNLPNRIYFDPVTIDRNKKNEVAMEAGKLYIIKPTKTEPTNQEEISFPSGTGITTKLTQYFTIPGVTFNKDRKTFDAKVKGEKGDEVYGGSQVQFVGTYVADKDQASASIPANSYVLNGNNVGGTAGLWYYRTVKTPIKAFRGWLQAVATSSAAKQLEYVVNGEVGTADATTGIQGIVDDLNAKEGNIYNLNGQLVRANATSHDGLAKGVYIQNGKKFIVK